MDIVALTKKPSRIGVWPAMLIWIGAGILVTLTSLAIFSRQHCASALQDCGPGAVFGTGLVVAAASMAAGGLIGFIFGVPRVLPSEKSDTKPFPSRAVVANTNLEQISDWLTKILVGIGLTQFKAIGEAAHDPFRALALLRRRSRHSPLHGLRQSSDSAGRRDHPTARSRAILRMAGGAGRLPGNVVARSGGGDL